VNLEEYNEFSRAPETYDPRISIEHFYGHDDGTLLYGYDVDRNSFHVFLKDGLIWLHRYYGWDAGNYREITREGKTSWDVEDLLPNKRAYPQYTDRPFAEFVKSLGFSICHTTWSEPKREGPYYGATEAIKEDGVTA